MIGSEPEVLRGRDLLTRFVALDRWLAEHRGLWHPRPFAHRSVPWAQDHPDLVRWLTGLEDGAVDTIDAAAARLAAAPELPEPLARWLREARALAAVGAWPRDPAVATRLQGEPSLRRGVRARKWEQVASFSASVTPLSAGTRGVVDWCGGKAHLGRTLSRLSDLPVAVIDHDERLRLPAQALADRCGVPLSFVRADALDPATSARLSPGCAVVALHACGGLTIALIAGLDAARVPDVALAPCCFHLAHGDDDGCRPLSRVGRAAALGLDRGALRLATSDEVLATPERRALRRRESAWRLGLDLLLREASGEHGYTSLGALSPKVLGLPFGEFCRAVADSQGHALPARWSADAAQAAGEQRARAARALALVRAVFRRPLELWLVLDRALALVERGYSVGVGTFCESGVTPRNLLIRGRG